jgi:hypothetical protein
MPTRWAAYAAPSSQGGDAVVTVSEIERSYAETLGKMARTHLPHLDWEEVEPHLMLGWGTSTHAGNLRWLDVCEFARDSWERNASGSRREPES